MAEQWPKSNRGRSFPVEPLTDAEAEALLGACSKRAPSGVRNRAMLAIMWRSGLRCSEVLDLAPRDVDLPKGTIRVRHGKGDKQRMVGIDTMAASLVELWKAKRAKLGIRSAAPLFCQIDKRSLGAPMDSSYVRQMFKRLGQRAGIEKRVHPHGLRHSFASSHADAGTPVHLIQELLGHSSLATTSRYVSGLNPRAAIEAVHALGNQRDPGGDQSPELAAQMAAESGCTGAHSRKSAESKRSPARKPKPEPQIEIVTHALDLKPKPKPRKPARKFVPLPDPKRFPDGIGGSDIGIGER